MLASTNQRSPFENIDDRLLLAMLVDSGTSAGFYQKNAAHKAV